jgi:hypothetical protein
MLIVDAQIPSLGKEHAIAAAPPGALLGKGGDSPRWMKPAWRADLVLLRLTCRVCAHAGQRPKHQNFNLLSRTIMHDWIRGFGQNHSHSMVPRV